MKQLAQSPADTPLPGRIVTAFGPLDVSAADVLTFPQGLPGFERCRHFVLVSSADIAPLQYLQGIDTAVASFVALDPRFVLPDYRCALTDADRTRLLLGTDDATPLVWLALVTIAGDGSATVNLRAPIVINPQQMIGYQLVPCDSLYPLRHPLPLE